VDFFWPSLFCSSPASTFVPFLHSDQRVHICIDRFLHVHISVHIYFEIRVHMYVRLMYTSVREADVSFGLLSPKKITY